MWCRENRRIHRGGAEDTARLRRNRNSDYLPQRRKGRKGRKITVKNLVQNNSSLPSELGVLCGLAGVNSLCSNIPDTGKFAPAAQTFEQYEGHEGFFQFTYFVFFANFVVKCCFDSGCGFAALGSGALLEGANGATL